MDQAPEKSPQSAGAFSSWLRDTRDGLRSKTVGAKVPCGACTGCCRSSMFIHIRPDEAGALKRIPKALQFPAPGLPKGNVLLGYKENGECPMLVENQCSIYEDRPQTCRDYDCRVFAATGIGVSETLQPLIAAKVKQWHFEYPTGDDRKDEAAVQAAARFLQEHKDLLPAGALPDSPTLLAVLAIKVYDVFAALPDDAGVGKRSAADAAVAKAVLAAMDKMKSGERKSRSRS